jgi:hypothetical protein
MANADHSKRELKGTPTPGPEAVVSRLRTRLERERSGLERWQQRLLRCFHAYEKQLRLTCRLERRFAQLKVFHSPDIVAPEGEPVRNPVTPFIPDAVGTAEVAVKRLVDECHKNGPLYQRNPKAVAQVSRNAKWLLNALGALNRALNETNCDEANPPS